MWHKKKTTHIWSPPWFLPRPPKTCHFLNERVIGVSHTEVLSPLDDNSGFCSNETTLGGLLDSFRLREGSPERPSWDQKLDHSAPPHILQGLHLPDKASIKTPKYKGQRTSGLVVTPRCWEGGLFWEGTKNQPPSPPCPMFLFHFAVTKFYPLQ